MTPATFVILLAATVLAAAPAWALDDPTRPPLRAAKVAATPAKPAPPLLILQSVIRSPNGDAAIISGKLVPVGGHIGAARLVRVSEDEAVLRVDGAEKRLPLYPAARKRVGAAR